MSERQRIGQALEQLTYDTLKQMLQSRIGIPGEEKDTKKGIAWTARNYTLFWNKQVVKKGQYQKNLQGWRKKFPDLVLSNSNKMPRWFESKYSYSKAVLAIECKNLKLDHQWTSAQIFDRDVTSRFVWGPIERTLSMDDWEKYNSISDLFPQAGRVLIATKFAFHPKAMAEPAKRKKLAELDDISRLIEEGYIAEGSRPKTWSEKDQIEWRIMRIGLKIHELGYRILPDVPVPEPVRERLKGFLASYMDELGIT